MKEQAFRLKLGSVSVVFWWCLSDVWRCFGDGVVMFWWWTFFRVWKNKKGTCPKQPRPRRILTNCTNRWLLWWTSICQSFLAITLIHPSPTLQKVVFIRSITNQDRCHAGQGLRNNCENWKFHARPWKEYAVCGVAPPKKEERHHPQRLQSYTFASKSDIGKRFYYQKRFWYQKCYRKALLPIKSAFDTKSDIGSLRSQTDIIIFR